MAQHVVSHVCTALEVVFEQDHVINQKVSTQQTQNEHTWDQNPNFHLFPKFENTACSTKQVIALWVQAVSFLQLSHSSQAGQHASTTVAGLGRKRSSWFLIWLCRVSSKLGLSYAANTLKPCTPGSLNKMNTEPPSMSNVRLKTVVVHRTHCPQTSL